MWQRFPFASMFVHSEGMLLWKNDWLDDNWASNYKTPEFWTSGSPTGTAAEQASPVA
jgi:hypothetical protein